MMLKKIIALVLLPAVLVGSLTNISFAANPPAPDAQANNRASFTVFLPQNEPTAPVLSKEEKEANKLEGYLSEKIQDCYSDIIKESPCMKVAFEDIQQITSKKFPGSSKENKLFELEAEKKSLLAYKNKIEENNKDKIKDNEGIKKQLKNIDDRLLAIDYTENFLNNYQKDYKLALGIGLGFLFGYVFGIALGFSL